MLPTFKEFVEELFATRPGQGGLRHRDAGARHQHAGPLGRDREARRSGTARRTPTSRRGSTPSSPAAPAAAASTSRATRRALAAGHGPRGGRRPRLDPHLPAALVASGRRTTWRSTWCARSAAAPAARAAGVVVRAVPGRPGGRRAGPAGAQGNEEALRGLRGGDDLPPRRLRGVRRAAAPALRTGRPTLAKAAARRPARRDRRLAGGAAARRRDRGARRPVRRAGRGPRPGRPRRPGRARAPTCSPPTGRSGGCRWSTSRCRSRRSTGCGSRSSFNARNPQSRRDLASTLRAKTHGLTPPPPGPGRRPRRHAAPAGGRRARDHPAAGRAARAPVPRLRRARGPRPLGRALPPAGAGHRGRCSAGIEQRTNTIARTVRPGLRRARPRCGYLDGDKVTDDRRAG